MAFKWVQCLSCFNTMHISKFPPEVKKKAGKLGHCICICCLDEDKVTFSRLQTHGHDFVQFMGDSLA